MKICNWSVVSFHWDYISVTFSRSLKGLTLTAILILSVIILIIYFIILFIFNNSNSHFYVFIIINWSFKSYMTFIIYFIWPWNIVLTSWMWTFRLIRTKIIHEIIFLFFSLASFLFIPQVYSLNRFDSFAYQSFVDLAQIQKFRIHQQNYHSLHILYSIYYSY